MDFLQLDIAIDQTGRLLSAVNDKLAAAPADPNVLEAAKLLGEAGLALAVVQRWSSAARAEGTVTTPAEPPAPQQAGDSWQHWTGPVDVGTLSAVDARFASMVMSSVGSMYWLDKIGGREEDIKRWLQSSGLLAANYDMSNYISSNGLLVQYARTDGLM